MCDTLVALGRATADGATILGKNSDREPNEAHHLVAIPGARHAPGSAVRCTYVEIPQVEETYAVLLAKPFWIWGAEMGANEHGVAIGNEAVFTRVPYDKTPGLIGMDLLRLALERARTARAALDVITGLLAQYGQGGNCGFRHPSYYHNSFLIADPQDAWVLETAGRHWAAEQVKDVRSISNALSIGREWDLASPELVGYAVERGWCRGRDDFHFARCYSAPLKTRLGQGAQRQSCTTGYATRSKGQASVATVMQALRDHGPAAGPGWSPARGVLGFSVCAHAAFGPVRATQTTGSWVSHLSPGRQTHFVTGTAAPCTSIFKPVWLDAGLPDTGPAPTGEYDPASLFWQHERLHRSTLRDYPALSALYCGERDRLEERFVAGAQRCGGSPAAERAAFSAACFAEAGAAEGRWLEQTAGRAGTSHGERLYRWAWRGFNRAARLPE